MSVSPPKSTRKRGRYHHGNLRAALVEAARALVEEQGTRALTLREVARRVGVTHAAPYRHFKDKAALLAALAESSYARVLEDMHAEVERAPDPRAGVAGAAGAYVRFATSHPASYEVMFAAETGRALPIEATATRILGALHDALEPVVAGAEERAATAAAIWSHCHGLAILVSSGRLALVEPEAWAREIAARLVKS